MYDKNVRFQKAQLLLVIAYFIPVVVLFFFVSTFTVNVPVSDDWALVDFFGKIHSGTANFTDLFVQHNEHRILFPRIIFAILAFLSRWNIKVQTYFSLLLGLISFTLLYKIAAYNYHKINDQAIFHLFNLLTCVIFFSLLQYENWLLGFQIAWFFVNICIISSVYILALPKKNLANVKLLLASLCCFVASFSSAHGLLSWLAILPSIYLLEGKNKQKKIRILVWMLLFAFCVFIYFIGYEKPSHHPSLLFVLQQPLVTFEYFLNLIGFSLGKNNILPPVFNGLIIVLTFLFFNFFCFKNYPSEFVNKAAPWLSLGYFAIFFASITTVGRSGFGADQAMSSRYVSVSILLVIACLQLCQLWILYKWESRGKSKYNIVIRLFLGFVLSIVVFSSTSSIVEGQNILITRKAGQTCLEIINFIDKSIGNSPSNCLKYLYPNQLKIRELSKTLQELEFRYFPQNMNFVLEAEQVHGYIDVPSTTEKFLTVSRSDTLNLLGWAILPEGKEQPPIVLLSYGNNQSFFATGLVNLNRPDVVTALNSKVYSKSGWEVNVSLNSTPLGETVIKAWVYDQNGKQFIKLNGELKIKVVQ